MADDYNEVMTIKELAAYLRVHPTTIYRQIKRGEIPAFRVGANWRFNRATIAEWSKTQTLVPMTKPRRKKVNA